MKGCCFVCFFCLFLFFDFLDDLYCCPGIKKWNECVCHFLSSVTERCMWTQHTPLNRKENTEQILSILIIADLVPTQRVGIRRVSRCSDHLNRARKDLSGFMCLLCYLKIIIHARTRSHAHTHTRAQTQLGWQRFVTGSCVGCILYSDWNVIRDFWIRFWSWLELSVPGTQ